MENQVLIEKFKAETLLQEFAELKQEIKELKENFQPKKPTEYMDRRQVADMLQISLPTVHSWINRGILTRYRIGNKTRFKRHEVEGVLNESANC